MSAHIQPNEIHGEALIEPSTPAENSGLDNEEFELIVYENTQIVDPADHVYTITGLLGAGQFGHVYSVSTTTPDGEVLNLAMKISKSTVDSTNMFEYEAQALSYVCIILCFILLLYPYNNILSLIKNQRICISFKYYSKIQQIYENLPLFNGTKSHK